MKKPLNQRRLNRPLLKFDLKMKLTTLLLITTLFGLHANDSYAQKTKVTLDIENNSVSEIIDNIESATEFRFIYKTKHVDLQRKLSLKVTNELIETVLANMFKNTRTTYKVRGTQIILREGRKNNTIKEIIQDSSLQPDDQLQVSGQVVDSNGVPLGGANIIEKGTTNGTQADFDGNFSIEVANDATLVVSYLGFATQEVVVNGQTILNIALVESAAGLDEIVVVGYGTQKKSNLTAAIATVDTRELKNRPVNSVTEMLTASTPGLNIDIGSSAPDANPGINLRGFTGITQNNAGNFQSTSGSPLIIIDGVPLDDPNDLKYVNPQDVEKISVLKDASATAIYGSRAPNGAILITTKSGEKGRGMKIEFSSDVRISTPLGLPNSLSGSQYAYERNSRRFNSRTGGVGVPLYTDDVIDRILAYEAGEISTTGIILDNGRYGSVFTFNASENHIQEAFRNSVFNQNHNLSISGGSDTTTYFASFNALDAEGTYASDNDWLKRYVSNVRLNTDIKPWLNVGLNIKYSREETLRPTIWREGQDDELFFDSLGFPPTIPAYYDNGTPNEFSIRPNLDGSSGSYSNTTDILTSQITMQVKPFKDFTINGDYTWRIKSQFDFNTEFQFGGLDNDGTALPSRRSPPLSLIEEIATDDTYHTANFNINYAKSFGNHNLDALLGYNEEVFNYRQLSGSNSDFYTTEVPSLSTTFGTNFLADDRLYSWAVQGYVGRLNYNYKEKYLLSISGRYDGTSRYAPDSRWNFSKSISGGYDIAKENFWPLKDAVSQFKLTAKYGETSNQGATGSTNAGLYTYLPTLGTTGQITTPINGSLPSAVSIPPILADDNTWAKPRNIGFGLDVAMFKNRLTLNYEWYQRTIYDQIGPAIQLPEVLGTAPPIQNNSVTETRGFEFNLNWRDQFDLGGDPFSYGVRLGLSDYIGYVVEYEDNENGTRNGFTPGQIFGELYGMTSTGIAQNQDEVLQNVLSQDTRQGGFFYPGDLFFEDTNGDGLINAGFGSSGSSLQNGGFWYSPGDRKRLGFTYPRYNYNIAMNASWKSFSLSVLFQGVGHQKVYFANKFNFGTFNFLSVEQQERGWWTADNPDAFYPRAYRLNVNQLRENVNNDQFENNLAHLRIKNVGLTYNFPSDLLQKMSLSNLSLTLSGENLGFIFNKSWSPEFDPITLQTNSARTYPPSRTISLGFRVGI
nr:SusC/RagA family TonB-linked outer membrane protein [uncultured Allomuricauda sp.]